MSKVIYEFELPNKTILEIEGEQGKQAEATAKAKDYIKQNFNQTAQPEDLSALDVAKDVGVSAARGITKGIAGTLALPSMAEQGIDYLMRKIPGMSTPANVLEEFRQKNPPILGMPGLLTRTPTYQDIMGLVPEGLREYDPQTTAGGYAETIAEFTAPGGIFARTPKAIGQVAAIGTGAGAAQETAEIMNAPVWAQVPITLSTALALGYATSPSRAAKIANQALKGVDDAEIALAMQLEKKLKEQGINLTAPELIDNRIIQKLGETVYGTEKGGQIMYNYIKNRPEELNKTADRLLDEISKRPDSLRGAFKDIKTTTNKALTEARKDRKLKSQEAGYKISNEEFVDESSISQLINRVDEEILNLPSGSPTIAQLKRLKTRLTKEKLDDDTIIPETNINKLDSSLKEFRQKIDDSFASPNLPKERFLDKDARRIFSSEEGGLLDDLNDILKTNSSYANAKDTFARLSDDLVKPVEDNLEVLLKNNITPSKIKEFIFNPEKNSVSDIKATYKVLNKTNKETFPLMARTYIENAVEKAFVMKPKGESLKSGFNLYKALSGTSAQKNNFNQVLKGVAEAQGVNENNLLLGWRTFSEGLKRTARLANVDNPSSPIDPRFVPRDIAQIGSFMWRVKFAGKAAELLEQKAIKQLANIFTQKNSVELLVELGKQGVNSNDAIRRIAYIISITDPQRELTNQEQEQSMTE